MTPRNGTVERVAVSEVTGGAHQAGEVSVSKAGDGGRASSCHRPRATSKTSARTPITSPGVAAGDPAAEVSTGPGIIPSGPLLFCAAGSSPRGVAAGDPNAICPDPAGGVQCRVAASRPAGSSPGAAGSPSTA